MIHGATKKAVYGFVAFNPGSTVKEISAAVGVSHNSVQRHICDLRALGLLEPKRRRHRGVRASMCPDVLQEARLVSAIYLISQASIRCAELVQQLGDVTSVSEVADVYQGLSELSELLTVEQ